MLLCFYGAFIRHPSRPLSMFFRKLGLHRISRAFTDGHILIAWKYQERLELMNAFFSTSRSASPPLLQIMLETMLLVSS